MAGILYGIGVGPGDPELLTLKAVRIIKESQVIAVPGIDPAASAAWQIVSRAVELEGKEVIGIPMPMTKDEEVLRQAHEEGAGRLMAILEQGRQTAFLTLGDPTVYSTFMYVQQRVLEKGYESYIVSGVPSFCAAAALLKESLGEKDGPIHIIPASYPVEESLLLPGTKVLMKAGRQIGRIRELLKDHEGRVFMVENCGMETEQVYRGADRLNEQAGYYSLIIVKD